MDISRIIIRKPVTNESKFQGLGIIFDMQKDGLIEKINDRLDAIKATGTPTARDALLYSITMLRMSEAANLLGFSTVEDMLDFLIMYGPDALI